MQQLERRAVRFLGIARKRWEILKQPVQLSEQQLNQTAMNFYNHTDKLLRFSGATDGSFFSAADERIFFTERVAAYFFDGLFPTDDKKSINGRQNKINPQLRDYIQEKLPIPLARNPASTDLDFVVEIAIDEAAHKCYQAMLDIGSTYEKEVLRRLANFFLETLKGKSMLPEYEAPYWVKEKIKRTLTDLRSKLDALTDQ